ncbi:MAG: hypothetical protein QHJ81_14870, partial [Anaerolineae bacterium]|nr:hypothetical protein [Anaerolineae bacterium]
MHTHHRRWPILSLVMLLGLGFLGLSWAAAAPAAAPRLDEACQELLRDGGFESGDIWTINPSAYPAGYVSQPTHSGQQAMRLGIIEGFNRWTYSSIQQRVTLPATAQRITLRFHVYPLSEAPAGNDEQLMALLSPASRATIAVPWRALSNGRAWSEQVVDLSTYRGQTLLVYFNVYNDGSGGRTAMILDDVSLQACPAATATPTPRPTEPPTSTPQPSATATATATPIPWPTPTSPPGPCRPQCLPNGDFESYGYWTPGKTPLYPTYVNGKGVGGSRAMQLGNVGQGNVLSYSSVRQDVYIPAEASSVGLDFWYWPLSEGTDGNDHQELLLLQPQGQQVIAILWRDTRDDRQWRQGWVDLTPYRGQVVSVYFNVYNNGAGGRTAMYLDDVCLELCGPIPPTCLPKTPTPCWPTPTPTSCGPQPWPTCCYPPCDQPWCTRTATPTPTPESTPTATPTPPCGGAPPPLPPHRWWPWPVRPPFGWWGDPLLWLILATILALLLLLLAVLLLNRIRRLLQERSELARQTPEPAPAQVESARYDREMEVVADFERRLQEVARETADTIESATADLEELRQKARTTVTALSDVEVTAQRHLDEIRAAAAELSAAATTVRYVMTGEPRAVPPAEEAAPPAEAAPAAPPPEAAPPPAEAAPAAPPTEAAPPPEAAPAAPPPEAAPPAEAAPAAPPPEAAPPTEAAPAAPPPEA